MDAVCQAGFGGAVGCEAWSRWQIEQLGLVWIGTWQFLQWSFRGAFHPGPWEIGAVTL
jgi:hypothetical protein